MTRTMKGIAHFVTGVALATCFPGIVALAREGSLLPVFGGIGGLLPDFLDFRFVRYFEHCDTEIDPGLMPDGAAAGAVADALVVAIHAALEAGTPRRVALHTVQLGHDLWRRYTVSFDTRPDGGVVRVRMGPLVSTSGIDLPGSVEDDTMAERRLGFTLAAPYGHDYVIDSFTGPTFTLTPEDDHLTVTFLDWHHRWTHSLVLAFAAGALIGVLGVLFAGYGTGVWAGILTWAGFTAHVVEDQLGHMGCNLLWPFTRRRMPGLGLLHAGEAVPNFLVVWTALAVILYNLDRFGGPGRLAPGPYLALAIGVPWLGLGGAHILRRRAAAEEESERLAETPQGTDD